MNTTTVFSKGWIDIVFDGRNKAYGAYELRRINDRTLLFAMIFSAGLIAGASIYYLQLDGGYSPPGDKIVEIPFDKILESPPVIEPQGKPKPKPQSTAVERPRTVDEHRYEIVDTNTVIEPDTTETVETAIDTTGFGTSGSDENATANTGGSGTSSGNETQGTDNNAIIDLAGVMPEFPGGYPEFIKFIRLHVSYPEFARENGIEGTVHVGFVVEKDGSISQVSILRGVHRSLDEESMRVIKLMPKWIPGMQNGNLVRVRYHVPISYSLD